MWTGTAEAQNILDEIDFTGHPGIEGSDRNNVLKGKKVLYGSFEDSNRFDDNLAEILQTMGMPVVR